MKVTQSWLRTNFKKYNTLIFKDMYNTELPLPKLKTGNAKGYMGIFRFRRLDTRYTSGGSSYIISISNFYKLNSQQAVETLIHEMIHEYIQFMNIHDSSQHGYKFSKIMYEINQKFGFNITVSENVSSLKVSEPRKEHFIMFKDTYNTPWVVKTKSQVLMESIRKRYRNGIEFESSLPLIVNLRGCTSRIHGLRCTHENARLIARGNRELKKFIA